MKPTASNAVQYRFGEFTLDPLSRQLLMGNAELLLSARCFDALFMLIQHRGRVVSKSDLLNTLWPGVIVEENSVARLISDLRKALGAAGAHIVTVARRGYRFEGEVTCVEQGHASDRTPVIKVAILPFTPLSDDEDDSRLGIGLADALITRLSALRTVNVRPTNSVVCFARGACLADVRRELKVDAVLSGTIRRSAAQLRVTAQLIDAESETTTWAGTFDEQVRDLFSIEDSIAGRVVAALRVQLSGNEQKSLRHRQTTSPEAYELYLRGRFWWASRRTRETLNEAVKCFQRSTELDPEFALPHSALADTYIFMCTLSTTNDAAPAREVMPLARAAANRALAIDDSLGEAYSSLAFVAFFFDWNWPAAEAAFLRSIQLNPLHDRSHHGYAIALSAMERHDDAFKAVMRAHELDPTSMIIRANIGFILHRAGRHEDARIALEQCLAMNPGLAYTHHRLGLVFQSLQRLEDALRQYELAAQLGLEQLALASKGHLLGVMGRRNEAQGVLQQLITISSRTYVSPYLFAEVHAGLGDAERAFRCLQDCCDHRPNLLLSIQVIPVWDPFRDDPRFIELSRRMGVWEQREG